MTAGEAKAKLEHDVSIVVAGREFGRAATLRWLDYSISVSMVTPADAFSMTLPWSYEAWRICKPDAPAQVKVDGAAIITGFIGSQRRDAAAGTIAITGRDKVGRLVQESAPQVNFDGLTMTALMQLCASPWFGKVSLTNARNRRVLRGKGHKTPDTSKVYVDTRSGTRVEPGQFRWAVIAELAEQAGYTVWSSGDGKELIVGQPDYAQAVQYRFRLAASTDPRGSSNVLNITTENSTDDRYSMITVLGHGAGTDGNYGTGPADRAGAVKNNARTPFGDGLDF
jgi:prophage tail gpP-like protein